MNNREYNLEERIAKYCEQVVQLCREIKLDVVTGPIISQLIRSATSIGANYMEANGASSRKDFKNKIHICKKEAQETKHWMRMLAQCVDEGKKMALRILWKETQEFTLIFGKIISTLNKN